MDLVLRDARLSDDGPLVDIEIDDGHIREICSQSTAVAVETIECAGRVVIPGLIESHMHLDKALLDKEEPNRDGTLAGAISVTGAVVRPDGNPVLRVGMWVLFAVIAVSVIDLVRRLLRPPTDTLKR